MSREQVMGLIRHTLTFLGGFFILKGWIEEGMVQEISGLLMTLVGSVWSLFKNKAQAPVE